MLLDLGALDTKFFIPLFANRFRNYPFDLWGETGITGGVEREKEAFSSHDA